jgi:hypothetical protein
MAGARHQHRLVLEQRVRHEGVAGAGAQRADDEIDAPAQQAGLSSS